MEIGVPMRLRRLLAVAGHPPALPRALRNAVRDVAFPVFGSDDDDPLAIALDRALPARREGVRRTRRAGHHRDPQDGALVGL